MKRDIAERIAATSVEKVTIEQVQTIIGEFVSVLARCPVCEGQGSVTFAHTARFLVGEVGRGQERAHQFVPQGASIECPRCGPSDREAEGLNADPDWVGWRCYQRNTEHDCRSYRDADSGDLRGDHARCGPHVMIPVAGDDQ